MRAMRLALVLALVAGCSSKSAPSVGSSGTTPGSQAPPAPATEDAGPAAAAPVVADSAPAAIAAAPPAASSTGRVELIAVRGPTVQNLSADFDVANHTTELAPCATTDELTVVEMTISARGGAVADDPGKTSPLAACVWGAWKTLAFHDGTYRVQLAFVPRAVKRGAPAADYVAALTALCNAFPDDHKDHAGEDLAKLVAVALKGSPSADVAALWNGSPAKEPIALRRLRLLDAAARAGLPGCRLARVM